MSDQRITSFEEFWPFYVKEHLDPLNRKLHFIGSTSALVCLLGAAAAGQWWLVPVAPVVGYGFAWTGHFFVEKNKPASFKYPLWSFKGDWIMWFKILTGQMDAEVRRIVGEDAAAENGTPSAAH
jgi:hypothetical protein